MWNPESTDMEFGIHSVESGIQDSLGLPSVGPRSVFERPLAQGRSQGYQEGQGSELEVKLFVLHESFDRRSTRMWSKIYWALWTCWFLCDSCLEG